MKNFIFVLFVTFCSSSFVFADGDEAPAASNGAAKLLEDGEFTITEKSEKRLGLVWLTLKGNGPWQVPEEAIVKIKFTKAVYRKYEGKISLIILESLKKENGSSIIQSPDLADGDKIAIKGTKYIRLAELDISSGTVDSCAH